MKKKGLGKFLTGAAIGGALGVLFAPKKGSESRKELKEKATDVIENVKNADYAQIKKEIETKIKDLKDEVKDLDKEKALSIAKEKAKILKEKADEIVKLAIEKGTPIMEKKAEEAKEKTIELLNCTIKKLENSQKNEIKKTTKTTTKK